VCKTRHIPDHFRAGCENLAAADAPLFATLASIPEFTVIFLMVSILQIDQHGRTAMIRSAALDSVQRLAFEPDILCGDQFLRVFRQRSYSEREKKLMFAVLTDAIECFQKYSKGKSRRSQKLFCNAEAWIRCRDSSWPFSFENICEALDINPNYLRLGLMQWRIDHEAQTKCTKRLREPLRYQYRVIHTRVGL
jgi:hypothetical protein